MKITRKTKDILIATWWVLLYMASVAACAHLAINPPYWG